jgi:hypothetical protein
MLKELGKRLQLNHKAVIYCDTALDEYLERQVIEFKTAASQRDVCAFA